MLAVGSVREFGGTDTSGILRVLAEMLATNMARVPSLRDLLERLPLNANSDDFVFDNQILAETVWLGGAIGEVSCPTSYAPDASSINFRRSVWYGFGCLATATAFRLAKMGLLYSPRFPVVL